MKSTLLLLHNFISILLLFFCLLEITTSSLISPSSSTSHYLKLPLIHNQHSSSSSYPLHNNSSRILISDKIRHHHLLHRKKNTTAQLPIASGAGFGTGQYFVTLSLGTPAQHLHLVADTGSDLIWVSCSACRNCTSRRPNSAFLARHSTTFSPFHCFDSACELVPQAKNHAPCNLTRLHSTCRYRYTYADGSISDGFFAAETGSFNTSSGKKVRFKKLRFGCGLKASGPSVTGSALKGAQGVLGLGLGPISLPSQLGRKNFANKFSYCLKDYTLAPAPTSYLLIGSAAAYGGSGGGASASNATKMIFTPLINNTAFPTFYYIQVESILVQRVKLSINSSVWAIDDLGNGGTLLDSGTTLTFLLKQAYDQVIRAFERRVNLPRLVEPNPTFDFCVNVSGSAKLSLPRLSFKLGGGSVFAPPPGNYFIDTAPDVKCLALQPVTSPGGSSIIGNLMQQGFLFEFDKDRGRLGFTRQGCAVR